LTTTRTGVTRTVISVNRPELERAHASGAFAASVFAVCAVPTIVGTVLGSLIWGHLGDRIGRRAAILLAQSFPNALAGLGASRSAANLRRHGLEADVERCARENDLDVVPRYVRRVGPAAEVTA